MTLPPRTAKDIFLAALDRQPAERGALLDEACAGDAALRRQVEALLRVHDEPDSLLDLPRIPLNLPGEGPPPDPDATLDPSMNEQPGSMIGPYKLLQEIGHGGMGVVYMAEQTEPVERRVALKIIKPGMDTRQVIARFDAEEQALAMMDHPNIARVLDAGITDNGRPYFVMELVKGIPITTYCDQQRLTPRERLELFIPVCHAVQHAHQKGIIHRDIKPSNVLVALYDDRPVPKVIDFGVAKATNQRLTKRTMFTHYGQIVGTLEYMSPEQANLNQLDIDTRSDIYSLGVLLYELLTGVTPFDRQRLHTAAFDEMLRIIREEEPPKPSTRLSASDSLPSVAANRHTEPKKLSILVRGELDWIVMKALDKDRTRRYETANGLANDLQRYLDDEPVVASPPSRAYRFRKFARRNKAAIVAALVIAAALILGLAGTSWQAVRATRAERAAQTNFEEEQQARREAIVAEQEAKRQLFHTSCAQAQASRWSGRPGQRRKALDAITQAVGLIEPLGLGDEARRLLRNEAIGAMTLVDIHPIKTQRALSSTNGWVTVSEDCRLAAVSAGPGQPIRLFAVDDPAVERARIPVEQGEYGYYVHLGPGARYLLRGTVISSTWQLTDPATGKDAFAIANLQQGYAADFHPGGQQLAAGDTQGVVRFFELPSGKELRSFACDRALNVVKYSPDGHRIAVSGMAGPLEVRDAESGAVGFEGPPLGARVLDWHPDGTWIAVGTAWEIHLLEIREPRGGRVVCHGHQSATINAGYHPGGQLLASAAWDGTTRLWDAGSGHQLLRVEGSFIRFSADGRLMAGCQGLNLNLWEVDTPEAYRWLYKGMTMATAVTADGRLLVSAHHDGARLWDLDHGRQVGELPIGPVYDVTFHPDGSLVTGGASGLYQWPLTTKVAESGTRVGLGPPQKIACGLESWRMLDLSRDGRTLLAESRYQDEAVILHLHATPPHRVRLTAPHLVNVALSPDGKWAAASSELGKNVKIWNVEMGKLAVELPTVHSALIRFSPDNRWLVTNTGPDVCIWEVDGWRRRHEIPTNSGGCSGIAFTSDSRLVAVGLWGIGMQLIDVETGQAVATLEAVQKPPAHVDLNFSADDGLLAAAVDNEGFCVWDMRAIRQRLAALGLDWNQPPLPDAKARDYQLLQVETQLGSLAGPEPE
jgi:eukaryotic-like serine/threonine-protein kinase